MSKGWSGGSTTRWRRIRAAILERDGYQCRIAAKGCMGAATCVDHVVQREHGGGDEPSNLRAACQQCNLGRKRIRVTEQPSPKRVSSW